MPAIGVIGSGAHAIAVLHALQPYTASHLSTGAVEVLWFPGPKMQKNITVVTAQNDEVEDDDEDVILSHHYGALFQKASQIIQSSYTSSSKKNKRSLSLSVKSPLVQQPPSAELEEEEVSLNSEKLKLHCKKVYYQPIASILQKEKEVGGADAQSNVILSDGTAVLCDAIICALGVEDTLPGQKELLGLHRTTFPNGHGDIPDQDPESLVELKKVKRRQLKERGGTTSATEGLQHILKLPRLSSSYKNEFVNFWDEFEVCRFLKKFNLDNSNDNDDVKKMKNRSAAGMDSGIEFRQKMAVPKKSQELGENAPDEDETDSSEEEVEEEEGKKKKKDAEDAEDEDSDDEYEKKIRPTLFHIRIPGIPAAAAVNQNNNQREAKGQSPPPPHPAWKYLEKCLAEKLCPNWDVFDLLRYPVAQNFSHQKKPTEKKCVGEEKKSDEKEEKNGEKRTEGEDQQKNNATTTATKKSSDDDDDEKLLVILCDCLQQYFHATSCPILEAGGSTSSSGKVEGIVPFVPKNKGIFLQLDCTRWSFQNMNLSSAGAAKIVNTFLMKNLQEDSQNSEIFPIFSTMTSLDLSDNPNIGDAGCMILCQALLWHFARCRLPFSNPQKSSAPCVVSPVPFRLQHLNLRRCGFTKRSLDILCQVLKYCCTSSSSTAIGTSYGGFVDIDLSENDFGPEATRLLSAAANITTTNPPIMMGAESVTATLKSLRLSHVGLNESCARDLRQFLSSTVSSPKPLSVLDISYNENVGDQCALAVGEVMLSSPNLSLREINLEGCGKIREEGISFLSQVIAASASSSAPRKILLKGTGPITTSMTAAYISNAISKCSGALESFSLSIEESKQLCVLVFNTALMKECSNLVHLDMELVKGTTANNSGEKQKDDDEALKPELQLEESIWENLRQHCEINRKKMINAHNYNKIEKSSGAAATSPSDVAFQCGKFILDYFDATAAAAIDAKKTQQQQQPKCESFVIPVSKPTSQPPSNASSSSLNFSSDIFSSVKECPKCQLVITNGVEEQVEQLLINNLSSQQSENNSEDFSFENLWRSFQWHQSQKTPAELQKYMLNTSDYLKDCSPLQKKLSVKRSKKGAENFSGKMMKVSKQDMFAADYTLSFRSGSLPSCLHQYLLRVNSSSSISEEEVAESNKNNKMKKFFVTLPTNPFSSIDTYFQILGEQCGVDERGQLQTANPSSGGGGSCRKIFGFGCGFSTFPLSISNLEFLTVLKSVHAASLVSLLVEAEVLTHQVLFCVRDGTTAATKKVQQQQQEKTSPFSLPLKFELLLQKSSSFLLQSLSHRPLYHLLSSFSNFSSDTQPEKNSNMAKSLRNMLQWKNVRQPRAEEEQHKNTKKDKTGKKEGEEAGEEEAKLYAQIYRIAEIYEEVFRQLDFKRPAKYHDFSQLSSEEIKTELERVAAEREIEQKKAKEEKEKRAKEQKEKERKEQAAKGSKKGGKEGAAAEKQQAGSPDGGKENLGETVMLSKEPVEDTVAEPEDSWSCIAYTLQQVSEAPAFAPLPLL